MSWLDGFVHRVRTVLEARAYERELRAEMQHHLDLEAMQLHDADRARRRFGNRTYYTEETRRMTWLAMLDTLEHDARFAWRSAKRNPGFTLLIVVTLSLGIGVNSATFSLLDRIYLRPPAGVHDPATVHRIWFRTRLQSGEQYVPSMTYPMFPVIRRLWSDSTMLALGYEVTDYHLGGTLRGARVDALFATANYWRVLGVEPQLGRFFSADEDRIGSGAHVAVLSDHLWRTQFGADAGIVGKSVKLDEERYTVIGIAPSGFIGADDLRPVDAWLPLATVPQPAWMKAPVLSSNSMYVFEALARSKPNDNLNAFALRATQAIRDFNRSIGCGAAPHNAPSCHAGEYADTSMSVAAGPLIFARGPGQQDQANVISTRLSAVALIVLIIAASNVVNLLLARATRRRREMAVRMALGVGRWRLVRLLAMETLILALLAAVVSVIAAYWGGALLRTLLLPRVRFLGPAVDHRVIAFTFSIAVLGGAIAGIIPALQASTPDLTRALKDGAREGGATRSRLRSALVVMQTALSVLLLVGAALFIQSLRTVRALDIGFDPPTVIVGTVDFDPGHAPPAPVQAAQMADVGQALQNIPGVHAVARTLNVPLGAYSFTRLWVDRDSTFNIKPEYPALNVVTRDFFPATGVRILRGRAFTDVSGAAPEVVINDAMARQVFPGVDPIGRCLRFDGASGACYAIVGIAQTARMRDITESPVPQYYLPMSNLPKSLHQGNWSDGTVLLVRAEPTATARALASMARALRSAFPTGYTEVRRLSDVFEPQYRPWRVGATLFTALSILALIVAIVGIYSTVSYSVSQRTHEFGIRIALGARIEDVLQLVLGEGLRTVLVGVVLGIALALAGGRLIASLLYGVAPNNPFVMTSVAIVLFVTAAAATLLPAWRAGRLDPMIALRSD